MKVSNTFSIDLEALVEFNDLLKVKGLKKSTVINLLIQEWLNDHKNGVIATFKDKS